LVPADGEEVGNAAAEAVPHAVFGDAGDAGTMVHGDFHDARAGGMGKHGHEAMKTVESKKAVERGALEGAEVAAGVAEIHAEHGLARFAGDAGGGAAEKVVLTPGAQAADDVVVAQFGEKAGKIGGVVLEVAVEREDDGRAGIAEAGPQGGALAGVAAVAEAAHAGVGPAGGEDFFPGAIGAGVVHKDELKGAGLSGEGGKDLLRHRVDVVNLVEHRDDDGNVRLHGGSTQLTAVSPLKRQKHPKPWMPPQGRLNQSRHRLHPVDLWATMEQFIRQIKRGRFFSGNPATGLAKKGKI
jgi:hypothetical protein